MVRHERRLAPSRGVKAGVVAVLAASALLIVALLAARNSSSGGDTDRSVDGFGIRNLYPSLPGGLAWVANWDEAREFREIDPSDRWFDAGYGSGSFSVRDGELSLSGTHPRMHVSSPDRMRQWRDVEITMYFKRVADTNVAYAGMVAVARTNHGVTGDINTNPCDTRGIGARMRYDGHIDFEKETSHPDNAAAAEKVYWPGGLPRDRWIGFKYVVFDRPNGDVKLELWIDLAEGRNGGKWIRINQLVDTGSVFGDEPCAPGVDPRMPLRKGSLREGSESGKPNISVYFRTDGLRDRGLVYKWGSIRDITAPVQ